MRILKYEQVGLSKIGSDNNTVTGPVVWFYSWKEWNTLTTVDVSSKQVLTFPSLLPFQELSRTVGSFLVK